MFDSLKQFMILPFLAALALANVHSGVMIVIDPAKQQWFAAMAAMLPMLLFMLYIATAGVGRTSRYMPWQVIGVVVGVVTLLLADKVSFVAAFYVFGLGLVGVGLYMLWYSKLERSQSPALQPGQTLPAVEFSDTDGNLLSIESMKGRRVLLLFYRGSWCPLCVAQIRELADEYRQLEARNTEVFFISPQAASESQKLARRFDIPARFIVDDNHVLANTLNIVHSRGVPKGMGFADTDTVLPTAVLLDEQGVIRWVDQTDNYRVRPELATFLRVLDELVPNVV